MSQILKTLSYYIDEPMLIFDKITNSLYQNKAFQHTFYNFSPSNWVNDIKKLEYKLHFDICLLESEQIKTYTPLHAAIFSKYDFSTQVTYQQDSNTLFYFVLKTVRIKNFVLIYFSNITHEIKCHTLELENEELKRKNQEFAITAPMAQNQAVKMAILNRVANSLRANSIDIKTLLTASMKELSIIFGAHKIYFASSKDNVLQYTYSYPTNQSDEILEFDKSVLDDINNKKINYSTTIKEHNKSEHHFSQAQTRIILPIFDSDILFGIIIIFLNQKNIENDEHELLLNILNQITGAVIQVNLLSQITNKKDELERTLSELKATQLQLINSEKMASLGQLIANVAHEINTPLASINANNEMMSMLIEKNPDKILMKDMLEIDSEAIKRISNLVKSLKRFVRLDEGELQQADINSEIDLTLSILHHKIKKGITITKNYATLPLISCYPSMLNQVFLNILSNAIDALKDIKNPEIIINTEIKNSCLHISIANNGEKIMRINRDKLFQAGFTTKKVGEGTGLGLAICKKIIDKHKGKISLSNNDKHTEFVIEIPV